mgnify:CR=1 FL=1
MRITNKLNTYNSINQVQTGMKNLYKSYNQLSSGLQIRNSYEGAGMYITNTRLEYEYATLSQIEDASKLADELMKNTDSTMSEMEKLLTQFKVKVTEAANATQTPTSREVIAKELETIRQQIVDLANTSINGQFLFSGSLTNTKPFDYSGNYYGDDKRLNIVTGDGVKNAYNIPGYDLFYKADNDFKKQITTNVSFTDNRFDLVQNKDKTRYLEGKDKISYLIGLNYVKDNANGGLEHDTDFDTTPLAFPPTALYVQGVKPDGTSFKSAVLVQPTDTIQGMLDKIGALYGNTTTSKVVDVSINKSGQIQITDLKQGNTVLDFHAVAYTPQFQTRDELKNATEAMTQQNPPLTGEWLTNQVLNQVFQNGNITTPNQQPVQVTIGQNNYNLNLHQTDFIFSKMTDTQNNDANGADYDNVYFETKNNKVIGNVSQVLKDGGAYATDSTKLSEVATGDLANTTLNLKVSSRAGNTYDVTINLGTSTVSYTQGGNQVTFPIMHTDPTTLNSGVVTPTNEITYRQLNDIIGLFADDRQPTATITPNNNKIDTNGYNTLTQAFATSRVSVNVDMDYKGRITVTDRLSAGTKIQIALTDSRSGVFPNPPQNNLTTTAQTTTGSALSFSANNALIIDEPHNDLINDLETMIQAVRYGYVRADSTSAYPRNTGMQGALERLDHLNEHIIKQRTIIGADQKAMSDTKSKVMTLKVNVKSTQNEVIGADLPEVYSQLMQQQLTYQAALKASTTLSQLSLLNYM